MRSETASTTDPTADWSVVLSAADRWHTVSKRALVIAPHPDDESVMFGGAIARAVGCGTRVDILAVTDGEAAYPNDIRARNLAELRRLEQSLAVGVLGVSDGAVTRLGLPDGNVAEHEDELATAIATHLEAAGIDLLLAPWERDHHADHEACGRSARRAVAAVDREITLMSGLYWALLREAPPAGLRLQELELSASEMECKRRAISCHVSQVSDQIVDRPVLGRAELAVTRWTREYYVVTSP